MKLTHEWQEYDHNYTKDIHDIRTIDGIEYYQCWPNAGSFHVAGEINNGKSIPDNEVTHVKMSDSWMTEEEEWKNQVVKNSFNKIYTVEPEENYFEYTKIIDRNSFKTSKVSSKQHKPNKGLKLGSYNKNSKHK